MLRPVRVIVLFTSTVGDSERKVCVGDPGQTSLPRAAPRCPSGLDVTVGWDTEPRCHSAPHPACRPPTGPVACVLPWSEHVARASSPCSSETARASGGLCVTAGPGTEQTRPCEDPAAEGQRPQAPLAPGWPGPWAGLGSRSPQGRLGDWSGTPGAGWHEETGAHRGALRLGAGRPWPGP